MVKDPKSQKPRFNWKCQQDLRKKKRLGDQRKSPINQRIFMGNVTKIPMPILPINSSFDKQKYVDNWVTTTDQGMLESIAEDHLANDAKQLIAELDEIIADDDKIRSTSKIPHLNSDKIRIPSDFDPLAGLAKLYASDSTDDNENLERNATVFGNAIKNVEARTATEFSIAAKQAVYRTTTAASNRKKRTDFRFTKQNASHMVTSGTASNRALAVKVSKDAVSFNGNSKTLFPITKHWSYDFQPEEVPTDIRQKYFDAQQELLEVMACKRRVDKESAELVPQLYHETDLSPTDVSHQRSMALKLPENGRSCSPKPSTSHQHISGEKSAVRERFFSAYKSVEIKPNAAHHGNKEPVSMPLHYRSAKRSPEPITLYQKIDRKTVKEMHHRLHTSKGHHSTEMDSAQSAYISSKPITTHPHTTTAPAEQLHQHRLYSELNYELEPQNIVSRPTNRRDDETPYLTRHRDLIFDANLPHRHMHKNISDQFLHLPPERVVKKTNRHNRPNNQTADDPLFSDAQSFDQFKTSDRRQANLLYKSPEFRQHHQTADRNSNESGQYWSDELDTSKQRTRAEKSGEKEHLPQRSHLVRRSKEQNTDVTAVKGRDGKTSYLARHEDSNVFDNSILNVKVPSDTFHLKDAQKLCANQKLNKSRHYWSHEPSYHLARAKKSGEMEQLSRSTHGNAEQYTDEPDEHLRHSSAEVEQRRRHQSEATLSKYNSSMHKTNEMNADDSSFFKFRLQIPVATVDDDTVYGGDDFFN